MGTRRFTAEVGRETGIPAAVADIPGWAAFKLGRVFLVSAMAGIACFLWNRNAWKMKRDQARAGDTPAVEIENGGDVLKLSGVRDTYSHEPLTFRWRGHSRSI